ncbi:MAG: hypothetical protein ABIR23_11455 [Novosphingobium sp.]
MQYPGQTGKRETVGMFKLLGKADTWLDVGMRWSGGFAVAWGGLSWLAKHVTWLGTLNWADAIALGLGGAMLLSAVISLALIAVRFFRPLPASPAPKQPRTEAVTTTSIEEIHIKIKELEAIMSRQDANLAGAFETIASLQNDTEGNAKLAAQNEAGIEAAMAIIGEVQKLSLDAIKSADEAKNQLALEATGRVMADERLRRSFSAMADKEWLERVEGELSRRATDLSAPTESAADLSSPESWSDWANRYDEWDGLLHDYIAVAGRYVSNANDIRQVDDALYGNKWVVTDAQFPDSEGARRYKKFRILLSQWNACRRTVNLNVRKAANEGIFLSD